MNTFIAKNRNLITFAIPLLLILSVITLAKSPIFLSHPEELSLGITLDLILLIPAVYFLLIRKREIPKITTVPFFIAGIIIASFIIPKDFQFYLTQVKTWVLPVVETTVFLVVIYKVRQLRKAFKADQSVTLDFYTALKSASAEILPKKLSNAFSTEIAVFYYGFFNWKKRKLNANEFSYHKKSSTMTLMIVFLFLIIVETAVVHNALQENYFVIAWILSILSGYTCLQILGIMRSLSKRPIAIENGVLNLRYGLFSESSIPLSKIESVVLTTKSLEDDETIKQLSPLKDLDSHNVLIQLNEEEVLFGLYGIKSTYNAIALHIDEKEQFEQKLKEALPKAK